MVPSALWFRAYATRRSTSTYSGFCLQWSYSRVLPVGQPMQTGTLWLGGNSGSLGKRVTEQWYACPAKTPTPEMTEECATWRLTTKSAPEDMPLIVMPFGSILSGGSGEAGGGGAGEGPGTMFRLPLRVNRSIGGSAAAELSTSVKLKSDITGARLLADTYTGCALNG